MHLTHTPTAIPKAPNKGREGRVLLAFLAIWATCTSVAIVLLGTDKWYWIPVFGYSLLVAMLFPYEYTEFAESRRRAEYAALLPSVRFEDLRWAATSPEIDDWRRDCIVGYLNTQYPGWSGESG